MKKLNLIKYKALTIILTLLAVLTLCFNNSNNVYAANLQCANTSSNATSLTLNVNEVSRNVYTVSVSSIIKPELSLGNSGAIVCNNPLVPQHQYAFEIYKEQTLIKSIPLTKGIIRHPTESYCILSDTGTRTVTLESPGSYRFVLAAPDGQNTVLPSAYLNPNNCFVSAVYQGSDTTCSASNVCRTGDLGGCSTNAGVCLLNPLDNTYGCYEPDQVAGGPPDWMIDQCANEVACNGLTVCQKGVFAGCDNESQICIAEETGGGSSVIHKCVDIDSAEASNQCGADACLSFGAACSLTGKPCCNQESTGKEGRCVPETLRCGVVEHDDNDFDDEYPDLDICPTCTNQYGDPQTLLSLIYRIITPVGIIIGMFLMVTCGYKVMFSHGDPRAVAEAKDCFQSAIIGMLFILLSVSILRLVINSIIATV